MSATLEWFNSGLGTKTGTTIAALFDDIVTLAAALSANPDYLWEVKGSNTGSTPYYISFGRKDGSAGRIALLLWSSAPAGNNSAILDQAPVSNQLFVAYFPNGTGTTLANLTASSGAITGNDTDCVKVAPSAGYTSAYQTLYQAFYFECQEGMVFGFQNPAATSCFLLGAGNLFIDASDVAYGCTLGFGNTSASQFGASSTPPVPWTSTAAAAGGNSVVYRTNYGAANRSYFQAFMPSGSWGALVPSNTDVMSNATTQTFYFAAVPLLGQVKGEGMVLKLRQICFGPNSVSAFQAYYENDAAGRVVKARQFNAYIAGGGYPWFYNDKI